MNDPALDLFGLAAGPMLTEKQRRKLRKRPQARGYAAAPGGGPKGETCGTCNNLVRRRLAKTYLKCGLMHAHWTGGAGSDVKARTPACQKWEAQGK